MSRRESFPGERVLRRAVLRLQLGKPSEFHYLGDNWTLERCQSWDGPRDAGRVYPRGPGRQLSTGPSAIVKPLNADGLRRAVGEVIASQVLSS